MYMHLRSELV